jgi:uncharacterized membrane protein
MSDAAQPQSSRLIETLRAIARYGLGAFLGFAGTSHLTWSRQSFLAQVPAWLPVEANVVVLLSGLVEITLGLALLLGWRKIIVGWTVAVFFLLVFPGNISQFVTRADAFGLDSDVARGIRLLFQPLLVAWALFSTGAWRAWRRRGNGSQTG